MTLIEQKRVQERQMTAKDALAGTTNTNVVAGVSDGKRATKFIVFEELAKGIEKVEQLRGHQSDAHKTSDRVAYITAPVQVPAHLEAETRDLVCPGSMLISLS